MRKELLGPTARNVDSFSMQGTLDGSGTSQRIGFSGRFATPREVARKTVQVEERGDVGVLSLPKRVPEET